LTDQPVTKTTLVLPVASRFHAMTPQKKSISAPSIPILTGVIPKMPQLSYTSTNSYKVYSMPRRKRTSQILEDAQNRIAALQTIDPTLDLGHGISVSAFNAKIEETRQALEDYNKALSVIDQTGSNVTELERSLSNLSIRMLSGIATVYGRSSSEYEMTNGSKRRRTRSATATKTTPTAAETSAASATA
jgi:uncharacterized protein YukE